MAIQNNEVSIPLLTDPPPGPEPISLSAVFLLGSNAVSHLLTGQPPLAMFSISQLITAGKRLHHLHIASEAIQSDPQDMLRVLGILLRE